MVSRDSGAVLASVIESDQPVQPRPEIPRAATTVVELRQELSGSIRKSSEQRPIFEVIAPDGRSLVSLERGE
jgi:hypothetical protein